ncbi:hypothetical protein E9549_02355 [Blastococcus sp. MG754426]|uniref:hypothetical protein n=1 Tax=unclassified Blastococcus TaxID=2619396 RepID=UPI001EEFEA06|nr:MULTISPECIES: hypothetical protein [unclassified Blastococcus]MCF6506254.1 hypothetical protein [Blastococcus sp. MG754426]MCF6514243.1 hypothetical protein [Blastococcus sp. MG754427]MCF6735653.1 hypothetical protein [Blastococcus sp. KM273129]
MAQPHQQGADDRGEGSPKGRRLGRVLIPLGILLVILGIFTYILVVTLGSTEDEDELFENEGAAAAVVLELPAPPAG